MGFLGILGKSDTGLKPIIYRAPVGAVPVSSASAFLTASKAIVRVAVVAPKVEAAPPPPPQAPPPPVAEIRRPVLPPPAPIAVRIEAVVAAPVPVPAPAALRASVRPPAQPALFPKMAKALVTWGPPSKPTAAAPAARGCDLTHLRQGVVLQARGEHEAAAEAFTKAIAADAACIEAYASRGISREALGDVAGARADYAKSIEVELRAGIARQLATAPEL